MAATLPRRARPAIDQGQERLIYSNTSLLHGHPPVIKTRAQLSLEENLQANAPQSQAAAQPAQISNPKFRETRPRLLLMGLRRFVPVSLFQNNLVLKCCL